MENYPPPATGSAGGTGQDGNKEETILQAILLQSTTVQNPDLQWLGHQLQAHYNDDDLDHELWLCQMYGNSPTVANLCGTRPITAAEAEDAWDDLVGAYYTWYNTVYQPAAAGDIPGSGQSGATTSVQNQPTHDAWTDDDTAWLTDFLNACTQGEYPRNEAGLWTFFVDGEEIDERVAEAFIDRARLHHGGADALAQVLADTHPATEPVSAPQQQIQGAGYVWTPDPAPQPASAAPPSLHPHPHPATPAWSQMDEDVLIRWLDWLAQMDQQPTWNTIANGLAQLLASEDIHDDPTAWWTTAWESSGGRIAYLRQYHHRQRADASITLDAQITYAWESTRRWALANQQQQTQNQPQAQPPAYTWTPDQQQDQPQQPAYTWVPDPQTQQQHYPQPAPQTHPPAQNPQAHPRNQPTPHPAPPPSSGQPKPLKRKQPTPDPNLTGSKGNQGKRQRQRAVGENAFSRKIWKLREDLDLTQKELAKELGVGSSVISRGESGIYIDPDTAHRWIQAATDNPKIREELQTLYNAIYQDGREGREDAKKAFSKRMQQLREERGLVQAEVEAGIDVPEKSLTNWEYGRPPAAAERANRWINFLTAGLQDRESVRTELRRLYEKAMGRKFSWTD
ncbi:helix-turn-helix transcriptional regulator [Streptomyces sp. NBC_01017]|uniref:helix-turn-helix domain-containing protein n=1 Tax=Streptomyces sp. NBC_01017 TaxID=2903721 RepID=UPI003868F083|nr:helix-turn-helix transcriptional regulator [Streptomyces sp. NBC_01017]WSV35384.1 helix-turn-helix transcriptional regulator [Streptomyces sp. NBC_01017]